MTGSIKWFRYQTDSGAIFAFRHDESNIENIQEAALTDLMDFTAVDATSIQFGVPRNLKMRYAVYRGDDGLSTKRIVVPSQEMKTAFDTLNFTLVSQSFTETLDGVSVTFTFDRLVNEKLSPRPRADDTGKQDGDVT